MSEEYKLFTPYWFYDQYTKRALEGVFTKKYNNDSYKLTLYCMNNSHVEGKYKANIGVFDTDRYSGFTLDKLPKCIEDVIKHSMHFKSSIRDLNDYLNSENKYPFRCKAIFTDDSEPVEITDIRILNVVNNVTTCELSIKDEKPLICDISKDNIIVDFDTDKPIGIVSIFYKLD